MFGIDSLDVGTEFCLPPAGLLGRSPKFGGGEWTKLAATIKTIGPFRNEAIPNPTFAIRVATGGKGLVGISSSFWSGGPTFSPFSLTFTPIGTGTRTSPDRGPGGTGGVGLVVNISTV